MCVYVCANSLKFELGSLRVTIDYVCARFVHTRNTQRRGMIALHVHFNLTENIKFCSIIGRDCFLFIY